MGTVGQKDVSLSESILRVYGLDSVVCDYCGECAELVTGKEIYPHRKDLWKKNIYRCSECDAYVGCHPKTTKPLGRLANSSLRKEKMRAHASFDLIWKSGKLRRREAYAWLAEQLNIHPDHCHIGMFNEEMCKRVVSLSKGKCNELRILQ